MNPLLDALGDFAGYVGDALDKPGRAVRGVLAGRPDELLAALPFSDSAGWTDPSRAVSGRELLGRYGLTTGDDLVDTGLGFAADMALDPTTYIGVGGASRLAGAGAKTAKAAAGAADDAGRVGLKGLRDRFGMVIDTGAEPRLVGRAAPEQYFDSAIDASRRDLGTAGAYSSGFDLGFVGRHASDPAKTRRHEVMHGLIDQARKAGDPSAIPGAVGRLAARLPYAYDETANPLLRGLGLITDETAAHMAGAGRSLPRQLGGAYEFLAAPEKLAFYGNQLENISPAAASIYRNVRYAPGAAGVGAAAGYGLSELTG